MGWTVPATTNWLRDRVTASGRPGVTSARVVVSVGLGVGTEQDFTLIERLAGKVGAVGANRALTDTGYAQ